MHDISIIVHSIPGVLIEKVSALQGGSQRLGETHNTVARGKVPIPSLPGDTEPGHVQPINYTCGFSVLPGVMPTPPGETMAVPTKEGKAGFHLS